MADRNTMLKVGLALAAILGVGYYLKTQGMLGTLTPGPMEPGQFEGDRVFYRDGYKIREG